MTGVVASGAGSALLFAAFLVHPVFLPLAVFSPFPLALQRLHRGFLSALLATIFASSLLAGLFTPGQALGLLLFAAPGLLLSESLSRGRGLRRGGLWAFAFLTLVVGLGLLFAGDWLRDLALQPSVLAQAPDYLAELQKSGWTPEMISQWTEWWTLNRSVLAVVYPAAFVILGGMFVLANAALLRLYLARRDPGWLDGTELEGLRLPLVTAALFVLSGAAVVSPPLRPAAYNVLLVLAFFFALQGLAVVAFYARRLAAPPLLRAAVVLLVIVNPWAPQILALMGLFDLWLDLRKYAEPPADAAD